MCILLLTRKKPFQGENLTAVTHKIVYEPFTPAEEIIKDLPPGLTAILTRCLEKDPNRRYPRAAEIAAELRSSATRLAADLAGVADADDDTSATQEVPEETIESPPERTSPRRARSVTGGSPSIPISPRVAVASVISAPSSAYFATVPPGPKVSSSGWARRSRILFFISDKTSPGRLSL